MENKDMINCERIVSTLLDLVRIDSPSGHEHEVASYCQNHLATLGFQTETDVAGNLIAKLPGNGKSLLLNAHMDSVPPCIGIKPIVRGDLIHSDGTTILGADDRSGIAAILEVVQVLLENHIEHPPLEVVFTVREEEGLQGSKELDYSRLTAKAGIVLDHDGPAGAMVIAAPYQNALKVGIRGRAAHAGVAPEKGINSIRVAAEAIAAMPLGRIDVETTANIGIIRGGSARNAVPEYTEIIGEARSRDEAKLEAQTGTMVEAFQDATHRHGASLDVTITRNYDGFRIGPDSIMLQCLMAAARAIGREPRLEESGGGSDVNHFRAHGIDAVAISIGFGNMHTTEEYQDIPELVKAAEILLKAIVSFRTIFPV